jgi:hypothetical protein
MTEYWLHCSNTETKPSLRCVQVQDNLFFFSHMMIALVLKLNTSYAFALFGHYSFESKILLFPSIWEELVITSIWHMMIWWKPLCSVIRYGGPFHWNGESPVCRQMICNVLNALLCFASSGSLTMFCHLQFGNLPYGFGGNTWVLPPIAVEAWGSAPHWSSCRRTPRRWSKCFELEQVLPLSLTHTLGHDHKTLLTLMEVNNFQLCQLLNPQVSW